MPPQLGHLGTISATDSIHRTDCLLPCLSVPAQEVDVHTFARMVLAVLDLAPPAHAGAAAGGGTARLAEALHSLFALYLEFRSNPSFQQLGVFGAAATAPEDGPEHASMAAAQPEIA